MCVNVIQKALRYRKLFMLYKMLFEYSSRKVLYKNQSSFYVEWGTSRWVLGLSHIQYLLTCIQGTHEFEDYLYLICNIRLIKNKNLFIKDRQ